MYLHGLFVVCLAFLGAGALVLPAENQQASVLPLRDSGQEPAWEDVLNPQGEVSAPLPEVIWREDLAQAFFEARDSGRPMFVTLRCIPCQQCIDFDAAVLEGGPEITPLLRQFITVRLTDASLLDLRFFPVAGYQDLDLSWWGYLFSSRGALYSIFGGRDHVSDKTRISIPALKNTLQRVLRHHYDGRREEWQVDGPEPTALGWSSGPDSLPGYESWLTRTSDAKPQDCIQCHQVAEILRQPAIDSGEFDKELDLNIWPYPENLGMTLDRDHGLLVSGIEKGSAAALLGIQVGDELGAANGTRLFGQADFRGALHRGPKRAGEMELIWKRGTQLLRGFLQLEEGWRKTDLGWRMSVSQGNVGADPGFFPLRGPRAGRGTLSVKPFLGRRPSGAAFRAGLRHFHEVVAVNGMAPDLSGRPFLVWFRKRFDPGDTVTLRVRDQDKFRDIRFQLD